MFLKSIEGMLIKTNFLKKSQQQTNILFLRFIEGIQPKFRRKKVEKLKQNKIVF